jgi:hypothetical protein
MSAFISPAEKILELDCSQLMKLFVYGTGAFKQAIGKVFFVCFVFFN